MTPSEREAAKRALGQCVRSACAGAYAREVSSYLRRALDQIDADERLMEQVLESHDHFPHGVGAATDALRARLGQENDAEPEKPEKVEAAVAAMPRVEPKMKFQVGQWVQDSCQVPCKGVVVAGPDRKGIFAIKWATGSPKGITEKYYSPLKPCSPVCTAEQMSIGEGDEVQRNEIPVGIDGVPFAPAPNDPIRGLVVDTEERFRLRIRWDGGNEWYDYRWNIASIIKRGPDGPGGQR